MAQLDKPKKNYKPLVVIANIVIVIVILINCFFYANSQGKKTEKQAIDSFISTSLSMQKAAHGLLNDHQLTCNEWANYITNQKCTMDEALNILMIKSISTEIMSHIIDCTTLKGYAAVKAKNEFFAEDFAPLAYELRHITDDLKEFDSSKTHITQHFINPVDGRPSVGFCQSLKILENGEPKQYMLMRTIPMDYISGQLFFPDYEKARLSLITSEGAFVIKPSDIKIKNFWAYIKAHNKLTDEEQQKIKDEIDSVNVQVLTLLDDEEKESLFVCIPAAKEDWQFIAYVQKADITKRQFDLTIVFIVVVGLLLIIGLDGSILIYTNRRLQLSIEETRRANLAKTSFLSSMSHDIRTPMNAIVGMATIAGRNVDNKEHVASCLKKITLASNHLLTLINDILDISKIESGKLALNPVVFSLADASENLINIVRQQVREKGLNFEIHTSQIIKEYLFADEVRLNQIFINLLTNAVKYTEEGGTVTLTLKEEEIPGDTDNILLTYSVSDTGIGMTKEFQKTMYEAFSRAVDTRVNKTLGTGLGLAITKQMVDLMGGTIECESESGKGTTFTVKVKLPLTDSLTDDLVLPPMDVLIVDDDKAFLDTAADTFKSLGLTADLAKDGRTAVKLASEHHNAGKDYPVIVIDWQMPVMNGIETARQIREKVGDSVPIIVMSSYDWAEIEDEARGAGVNAFINKPFFRSTVYTKMSEILHLDTENLIADEDNFVDLKGLKILVAEDNELNWEITNELLSYYGVETTHAENGRECVGMIERANLGDFDVILMDIQMPLMNGKDATRAIRALKTPLSKNIKIIAMTADAFAEDIEACFEAGMDGHIPKPVDLKALLKELRRSMGGGS